jgi:hypothetical protein
MSDAAQPLRHAWPREPVRFVNKSERQCCRCGLVKVTRHEPAARPPHWTVFWMNGARLDDGSTPTPPTPPCIAIAIAPPSESLAGGERRHSPGDLSP